MASSISMLQNSFNYFLQGKHKDAQEQLFKFKQLKEQSDQNQSMVQINENIILCEYCQNRDQHIQIVGRLDEISDEIRSKVQKKKKQEDDTILQFNKAVIFYLAGKIKQSHQILKTIKDSANSDPYLLIKIDLLLIETSLILQDYFLASDVYRKLSSEEFITQTFAKQANQQKQDEQQQMIQQQQEYQAPQSYGQTYTSLLFGSEIPFPDQPPTLLCKEELQFTLCVIKFRLQALSSTKDGKKMLTTIDQTYKNYQQKLDITNAQQLKQNQQCGYSQEIQPYLKLHSMMALKMLKAQKQYILGEAINKCLRQLNPYSELQNQPNADFIQTKQYLYQGYLYNNVGCVHFKMEKYTLAAVYFTKAINSIKQLKESNSYENIVISNLKTRLPTIYLNLADSLYLNKNYSKALQIYNQLQESSSNSVKYWYNRGVCYIQLFHEQMPDQNELHQVIDDIPTRYTYEKTDKGASRRVILGNREVHCDLDEETQDLTQHRQDEKYDQALYQQSRTAKEQLYNAIKSFRNALYLMRKDRNITQKDEQIQVDQEQLSIPLANLHESSVIYLCYSLLSRGDFNQALQQCKEALEQNFSETNKFIIIQYILECHVQMNKAKDAQQFQAGNIISSFIQKYISNNQQYLNCRNVIGIQTTTMQQYSAKGIFYFNLAALHLHNNNTQLAWNTIQQLLSAQEININSQSQIIPIPILNLLIWYYLKTENVPNALQLVKRRRLLTGPIGKNKIQLLSVTK